MEQEEVSRELSVHDLLPYPVLIKKDGVPSYQVASLTDDLMMGVNFIVRGQDLWSSSLTQSYLAKIAGLTPFQSVKFVHHKLIEDKGHHKLSKSQKAPSYTKTQTNKSALINNVAESLGLKKSATTLTQLLESAREAGL